jgi:glycerol-3-phosphate acyltransferase PlsY
MLETPEIVRLLIAVAVSYFLGALPLADRVSKRRGVNVFNAGTGLAGSANVRRNVGLIAAGLVVVGDAAKGILAILISQALGVDGTWIVIPAAATIVGHWNSVFTGFKGGDGLVTLGGITLAVFPIYHGYYESTIAVVVAVAVALGGQKLPYSSLFCIVAGYAVIIFLFSQNRTGDLDTALAMGGLALVVFVHALFGHAKRRRADDDVGGDFASQRESG